ncbi:MAG TPA: CDP-archaeol synthase [Ruminococcus sp.]|nr:CDP-archaeol synthase [Ruminococcus sp.]
MRILVMYATLMPVVIAGAANMIFTKTSLYRTHNSPMDGGKIFHDGKRILGDNKTWAGFFGMIAATVIAQVFWGMLTSSSDALSSRNELYKCFDNTLLFNTAAGAIFGLAYVLCELPNSFIKRRINIEPGRTAQGFKGLMFFMIDQIDSLLGVVLILALFSGLTVSQYIQYILLGALTHIALNTILYALKIRRNI